MKQVRDRINRHLNKLVDDCKGRIYETPIKDFHGMTSEEKMLEALSILQLHLPFRNDRDAYLREIIEWGRGNREKPNPKDFGIG